MDECCHVSKQDVPEVEAVIALLSRPLQDWWLSRLPSALDQAEAILASEPDNGRGQSVDIVEGQPDQKNRDEVLALLLALFVERLLSSVDALAPELADEVTNASNALLRDGALSLGLSFDSLRFSQDPLAARNDLITLMRGRIQTRTAELRELGEIFLTDPAVRRGSAVSLRPLSPTLASGRPRPLTRQQWQDEVLRLLGVNTREWVPFVVDQWAYRWFVIGEVRGARAAGIVKFIAVNNPPGGPDQNTTPFCQWVHGRVIKVRKIEDQIDRHIRASMARDIDALMGNWPMIGRVATEGSQETWDRLFNSTIGLPPYHGGCRTRVRTKR